MNNNKLMELSHILTEAKNYGINVSSIQEKLNEACTNLESPTIKLVLMGAFSDGKTSLVAGVMGQRESNMKIDIEESSDELTFYHIPALGHNFEIVDTPGLFGTKEKEYDGKNIRYSDITRNYLAQAHIVIYVTNAVNPLKDSHKDILKYVLKDLNKLSSSIFVINKMDEAYELSDDEDFKRGERIKTQTFIDRLSGIVNLTSAEKDKLRICCVSSNPNAKGLDFWFQHKDKYLKRSRIKHLSDNIETLANSINKNDAISNASDAVIRDLVKDFIKEYSYFELQTKNELKELKAVYNDTDYKLSNLRTDVMKNRNLLMQDLRSQQKNISQEIAYATMDNFGSIVKTYIGEDGSKVSNDINSKFSYYCEKNNNSFQASGISSNFEKIDEISANVIKVGSNFLKNVRISADFVKSIRNIVASGFKFKPWGAVKMAKWASKALVFASLVIDGIMMWRKYKQKREFEDAKDKIQNFIAESYSSAENMVAPDSIYLENFAPAVLECQKRLNELNNALSQMEDTIKKLKRLYEQLRDWYGPGIDNLNCEEAIY